MRFQHNPFTDKLDISGTGPNTTTADYVTGNDGILVPSDAAFNINIFGNNTQGINTTGNAGTNTLTIAGIDATTSQKGVIATASNAQAAAQSLSTVALTPSNITSLFSSTPLPASQGGTGLSSPAAHSLLVTNGSSAFTALGTASNGQIPIGSIGSDPVLANITSLGGTIAITNGPGSINLEQFGGGGDVVGPGSATDNAIARFDGTTGKLIQNSTVIVSDVGNIFTPDSLYVGTATPSNPFDITIEKSVSGLIGSSIQNVSNNAAAGSVQEIIVQTATADAYTEYVVNGATTWSTGIDNSDSDKYKITTGSSPSAGTAAVTIDTSGVLSLSTALGVASGGTDANSFNINGVVISNTTTTGSLAALTLTNGQMVIGSTGAAPVAGTITSTDSSITVSTGAGTLNLAVAGGTTTGKTITGDSGGALSPTAGNWNILGTGSITTSGTGSTLTAQLTGITNHAIQIGAGTATLTQLGAGTTGQILQTNTTADPTWSTATYPSTATGTGTILRADGTNWVATTATYPTTTTINQLLYSSAANTIAGLATANRGVLTTGATGVPAVTALATDGQLIIGSTAGAPAAATLTAGANITITNAANSITIAASGGGGGGITWNNVTGASQTIAINNAYIANNVSVVAFTLPSSATIGDVVQIAGNGAGGWTLAQNSGQTIHFGNQDTTTGVGGSLASTNRYDGIQLVCTATDTDWVCTGVAQGNITVT